MDAFNEWLYATSDWMLFGIGVVVGLLVYYAILAWMFRGKEITPETRKELHDATER